MALVGISRRIKFLFFTKNPYSTAIRDEIYVFSCSDEQINSPKLFSIPLLTVVELVKDIFKVGDIFFSAAI